MKAVPPVPLGPPRMHAQPSGGDAGEQEQGPGVYPAQTGAGSPQRPRSSPWGRRQQQGAAGQAAAAAGQAGRRPAGPEDGDEDGMARDLGLSNGIKDEQQQQQEEDEEQGEERQAKRRRVVANAHPHPPVVKDEEMANGGAGGGDDEDEDTVTEDFEEEEQEEEGGRRGRARGRAGEGSDEDVPSPPDTGDVELGAEGGSGRRPRREGKSRLVYVNGVPVLKVSGLQCVLVLYCRGV